MTKEEINTTDEAAPEPKPKSCCPMLCGVEIAEGVLTNEPERFTKAQLRSRTAITGLYGAAIREAQKRCTGVESDEDGDSICPLNGEINGAMSLLGAPQVAGDAAAEPLDAPGAEAEHPNGTGQYL